MSRNTVISIEKALFIELISGFIYLCAINAAISKDFADLSLNRLGQLRIQDALISLLEDKRKFCGTDIFAISQFNALNLARSLFLIRRLFFLDLVLFLDLFNDSLFSLDLGFFLDFFLKRLFGLGRFNYNVAALYSFASLFNALCKALNVSGGSVSIDISTIIGFKITAVSKQIVIEIFLTNTLAKRRGRIVIKHYVQNLLMRYHSVGRIRNALVQSKTNVVSCALYHHIHDRTQRTGASKIGHILIGKAIVSRNTVISIEKTLFKDFFYGFL